MTEVFFTDDGKTVIKQALTYCNEHQLSYIWDYRLVEDLYLLIFKYKFTFESEKEAMMFALRFAS